MGIHSNARHGSPKLRGYTMIELIVVITLISILGVYASTRFDRTGFDERYYADDLLSAIRFGQKYAMTSGCAVLFSIDSTGFALTTETSGECEAATVSTFSKNVLRPWQGGAYVNLQPVPNSIVPSTNLDPVPDPITVTFYPQGWACTVGGDSTDVIDIILTGSSTTRTMRVVCSTGFVYQLGA